MCQRTTEHSENSDVYCIFTTYNLLAYSSPIAGCNLPTLLFPFFCRSDQGEILLPFTGLHIFSGRPPTQILSSRSKSFVRTSHRIFRLLFSLLLLVPREARVFFFSAITVPGKPRRVYYAEIMGSCCVPGRHTVQGLATPSLSQTS